MVFILYESFFSCTVNILQLLNMLLFSHIRSLSHFVLITHLQVKQWCRLKKTTLFLIVKHRFEANTMNCTDDLSINVMRNVTSALLELIMYRLQSGSHPRWCCMGGNRSRWAVLLFWDWSACVSTLQLCSHLLTFTDSVRAFQCTRVCAGANHCWRFSFRLKPLFILTNTWRYWDNDFFRLCCGFY